MMPANSSLAQCQNPGRIEKLPRGWVYLKGILYTYIYIYIQTHMCRGHLATSSAANLCWLVKFFRAPRQPAKFCDAPVCGIMPPSFVGMERTKRAPESPILWSHIPTAPMMFPFSRLGCCKYVVDPGPTSHLCCEAHGCSVGRSRSAGIYLQHPIISQVNLNNDIGTHM